MNQRQLIWRILKIAILMYLGALQGIAQLPPFPRAGFFEVPFRMVNSHMIVEIRLADQLPLKFIFDTGAQHNILFEKVFASMAMLEYSHQLTIFGSDLETPIETYISRNVPLAIGPYRRVTDLLVLDENVSQLDAIIGEGVYGILGLDWMKPFTTIIDFDQSKIYLLPPEPDRRFDKYFHKKIPAYFDGQKVYALHGTNPFLLDTGSSLPLIRYRPQEMGQDSTLEIVTLGTLGFGLGGAIRGNIHRLEQFRLGDLELVPSFEYQFVLSDSLYQLITHSRQGIIGIPLLSNTNLVVDHINQSLWWSPRRNKPSPYHPDRSGLRILASGSDHRKYIIQHVQSGSPADNAGLLPGDEILSLGFLPSRFYSLEILSKKLSDPKKEKLTVKVRRGHEKFKVKLHFSDERLQKP